MEEYIAQSRYCEKGLRPASSDVTDFVDFPRDPPPSLRNEWVVGWEEDGGAGGGREREVGLACKIKEKIK